MNSVQLTACIIKEISRLPDSSNTCGTFKRPAPMQAFTVKKTAAQQLVKRYRPVKNDEIDA